MSFFSSFFYIADDVLVYLRFTLNVLPLVFGVFADNIFRATNKSIPFNIVRAIVFTIDGFVYFPNQLLTVKVIYCFTFQIQLLVLALANIVHIPFNSRDISIEFHYNRVLCRLYLQCSLKLYLFLSQRVLMLLLMLLHKLHYQPTTQRLCSMQ